MPRFREWRRSSIAGVSRSGVGRQWRAPCPRVDVWDVGEAPGEFVLAGLQLAEPVRHAPHVTALPDGRDPLLDLRQFLLVHRDRCAALAFEPFGLLDIRLQRFGGGLRRHQPVPQPRQHPLLDDGASDRPFVSARAVMT